MFLATTRSPEFKESLNLIIPQDHDGNTPLILASATTKACDATKIQMCKYLLEQGADKTIKNKEGDSATDSDFWKSNWAEIEGCLNSHNGEDSNDS